MELNLRLLKKTARAWGIQPSYLINDTTPVWSPTKTLIKVLQDLTRTSLSSNADLLNLIEKRREKCLTEGVEKSHVLWEGAGRAFYLYTQAKPSAISGSVKLENGTSQTIHLEVLSSRLHRNHYRTRLQIQEKLPLGYHELRLQVDGKLLTSLLICPPAKLNMAKNLEHSWGPFIPLYALRSGQEWGIGSLREMLEALKVCQQAGAKWLGTLPLLAVNLDKPDCDPSPYSALTRLFWNEIFLDVEELVEKYDHQKARALIATSEFQNELTELRATSYVDYYKVYQQKKKVLKLLAYDFFAKGLHLSDAYKTFVSENPEIDNYARFRSDNLDEQNFHRFVQFEMNESLREISKAHGLYLDFPVGVNDYGYDFKEFNSVFFKEVSVGAPPEEVFQQGQDWGFPSFNPFTHREEGYQYLRKSLRNHLKYCKILRLDHVMGLYRIYAIPKGFTGHDGVYLRFPKEDLFAIALLEAHKAQADIVGENLGTVPRAVEDIIRDHNLNGMWIMQMQLGENPATVFEQAPANAMIGVNNHDMPMWSSFMKGSDLDLVKDLKILKESSHSEFMKFRKARISEWKNWAASQNLTVRIHEAMAQAQSKYFVVNMEDLWDEELPQNIPGTYREYQNWRHKHALKISEWSQHPQTQQIFSALKTWRS